MVQYLVSHYLHVLLIITVILISIVSSIHQDCSSFNFSINLELSNDPSEKVYCNGRSYFDNNTVYIFFSSEPGSCANAKDIIVTQKEDTHRAFQINTWIPVNIVNQVCQLRLNFGDYEVMFADLMFYDANVWMANWTRFTENNLSQVIMTNSSAVTGNSTFTCNINSGQPNTLSMLQYIIIIIIY